MRLVLDEQRTTSTPTLKSGQPGKTKVSYGEPDVAVKWLWKFVLCRVPSYAEGPSRSLHRATDSSKGSA
jgi:hypothetical protein